MTHEQKIKALIEAGEKATAQHWQYEEDRDSVVAVSRAHSDTLGPLERWDADLFGNFYKVADARYAAQAANARESIKLLAEIAEAAGEYRAAAYLSDQEFDVPSSETQSHANARSLGRKFDALWAKYKEAQNG